MVEIPDQVRPRLPGGFRPPPFGIQQFLALMIVCVALWSLGVIWLGMQAAQQWVGGWQNDIRIHVYLDPEHRAREKPLREALSTVDGVDSVRKITPQETAAWMQQWLGGTGLDRAKLARRLPISFELTLDTDAGEFLFADIRDEAARFSASVNEEEVQLAQAHHWLGQINYLVWFATLVLALAMALIISNTLRMTILARADEVHLMRLLGAREWFVRMPFIMEGMLLGGGSGLLAWLLLWPLIMGADEWLAALQVHLSGLALLPPLLLGGAAVGCLGAVIATARIESPDSPD